MMTLKEIVDHKLCVVNVILMTVSKRVISANLKKSFIYQCIINHFVVLTKIKHNEERKKP